MKFHPYSEVFPLIEGAEFDALVADIKANGLREKIWLFEGKILDGRNRFLACQKAGVAPEFCEFRGDPVGFVISSNLLRRHLNESQRAMVGGRIARLAKGSNAHTVIEMPPYVGSDVRDVQSAVSAHGRVQICASSQTQAADALKVSRRSIQHARKVLEKGSEHLKQAVDRGDLPVSRAAAVADLPKSEQLKAATSKQESPRKDPVLEADWKPEIPNDEELAAIEREIQESELKVLRADDTASGYHEEIKRQAAEIAALKITRDGYMNGKAHVTKLLQAEQRKTDRLERENKRLQEEIESLRERIAIMEAA